MVNHSTNDTNKSLEPPLRYPGATPDAEARQEAPAASASV